MSMIINKYFYSWSPHVKKAKTVLDSGFHAMDSPGILILRQWNLDSGYQSLLWFRIPWAVFWIPKARIPDCTAKLGRIPDSTCRPVPIVLVRCWKLSYWNAKKLLPKFLHILFYFLQFFCFSFLLFTTITNIGPEK